MSCTAPICCVVPRGGGSPKRLESDWPVGRHPLGRIVYLPCGGCLACRRERRQELTLLQCCEASLHEDNWFLTLTYDEDHCSISLDKLHLSSFITSMRKHCQYYGEKFRFFAAGEYGELNQRPHYHLSVFGVSPQVLGISKDENITTRQKRLNQEGRFVRLAASSKDVSGFEYWQSKIISDRWPYGSHKIYRANRETYQYIAGYVVKKLTGEAGKAFRLSGRISEFQTQSRPSIGRPWFDKFCKYLSIPDGDTLVNDCLSIDGFSWKIPRIFSRWLERDDPEYFEEVKYLRSLNHPLIPDRIDLKRKADFDRYSAEHFKVNRSHKEV